MDRKGGENNGREKGISVKDGIRRILGSGKRGNTQEGTGRQKNIQEQAWTGEETDGCPESIGGNPLCSADGMSMESPPQGVWFWQCSSSSFSRME